MSAVVVAAGLAGTPTLPASAESFPVIAWGGPPPDRTTIDRYRELAEAGFTHNLTNVGSADAALKALDVAGAAGVKQIVLCPELTGADPGPTVRRLKGHPALGGYFVRDEPSAAAFAEVAAQVKRIQAADDRHPCYVNLFPNYATAGQLGTDTYPEYVDRFVREVPVPMLSFDHYPVIGRDNEPAALRPGWYENLEVIAAAARKAGRPMWAFALPTACGPYPVATAAHLRVQVFSNLAYGAQGVQYFAYWTPAPADFVFRDGPIGLDGKRTVVYDRVKEVNRTVKALRGVFLGAKVLAVGHTGEKRPSGTRPYQPAAPVREVKTGGRGAVVSHLSNGGRRFPVVVNRDINGPMPLTVALDGSAPVQIAGADGSLRPVGDGPFETKLDPGDVCVLTWPGRPGE